MDGTCHLDSRPRRGGDQPSAEAAQRSADPLMNGDVGCRPYTQPRVEDVQPTVVVGIKTVKLGRGV